MADNCAYNLQIVEFVMSDSTMKLRASAEATASALGSYASAVAISGCSIYVVLWLISWANGEGNGTIQSLLKWFARACFLIALAGTGSLYNTYVLDTFSTVPSEVAQLVANPSDSKISVDAEGKLQIGSALDKAANSGVCSGTNTWKQSSIFQSPADSVGYMITGLVIIVGVVIFVAIAAGLAIIAYASLFVVLGLGPLFLVAGIFESTRPMMESFFRTTINYGLNSVVLLSILGMAIGMIDGFSSSDLAKGAAGAEELANALSVGIRSLFVFAIAIGLLLKADDISSSLVGGISLGLGGVASRAASIATKPVSSAMKVGKAAMTGGIQKGVGEFLGGEFHRDPRSGKVGYRSAFQSHKDYTSALLRGARSKNGIGEK